MKRYPRSLLFPVTATLLLLATALGTARLVTRSRRQLDAQPAATHRWEQNIARLRQQRDATLARLESARQPSATPASSAEPNPPLDPAEASEVEQWVRQVKQLKQAFAQHPDQTIPELAVLEDRDWLRLARRTKLDTEDNLQRAFAIVRNQAKNTFIQRMRDGLQAYVAANHGRLPTSTAELRPYLFDPTTDPALLARYEMLYSGQLSEAPAGPILREQPLDHDDYDNRVHIERRADSSLTWGSRNSGENPEEPPARRDLNDEIEREVKRAVRAFTTANRGALPSTPAQLLPFFDPPLGPAMTEIFNHPMSPEQQINFEVEVARLAGRPAPR